MKGTLKIFDRHERCVGLRLWKSRTRFVQLWFCPKGYVVKPHSHNDQHIELMYLFGKTTFYRVRQSMIPIEYNPCRSVQGFEPSWKHIFRRFTVLPGQCHWFTVSTLPLIFINFATFIDGKEPVSASVDFHTT